MFSSALIQFSVKRPGYGQQTTRNIDTMFPRLNAPVIVALAVTLLTAAGCQTTTVPDTSSTVPVADALAPRASASQPTAPPGAVRSATTPIAANSHDGAAISGSATRAGAPSAPGAFSSGGTIKQLGDGRTFLAPTPSSQVADSGPTATFNFENGDIREIVKNIIGDFLGESFMIAPGVTGTITVRTVKAIPRSEVIPLLETVLKASGFALVRDRQIWRVVPVADAGRGLTVPTPAETVVAPGTKTHIYVVKHIGAKELKRVMDPFARDPQTTLQVDELRNLIFISASMPETERLLDIARMFDVNLLAGMSFAVYTLKNSDTKTVAADLDKILGGPNNPFAGLLRVVPIERMNAFLLISPQASAIEQATTWMSRLDEGGMDTGSGQKLYVYALQYTQAEKLQPVLQAALSGRPAATTAPTVAPGQTSSTLGAPVSPIPGQSLVQPGNTTSTTAPQRLAMVGSGMTTPGTGGQALARNATIVADKDRNALLIVATAAEYAAVEAVIRRLDVPPRQVAIELQIAQIALKGDFQFGLQSFMQSGKFDAPANNLTINEGAARLTNSGLFSYTWGKADAIKAVLSASQTKGETRTIAQPTLITVENQKATFNSGKQVSVRTQSTTSTTTVTGTDSFQYINTGISVTFTPRVTGRNIVLEIQQEISDTAASTTGSGNPDILRRAASTTVMVGSGDTMLMGGLFEESGGNGSSGLPLLSTIPVFGGLFGNQTWNHSRSELVMLITPRILENEEETRQAVDELRQRLSLIENRVPSASSAQLPTRAEDRKRLLEEVRATEGSLRIATPRRVDAGGTE